MDRLSTSRGKREKHLTPEYRVSRFETSKTPRVDARTVNPPGDKAVELCGYRCAQGPCVTHRGS